MKVNSRNRRKERGSASVSTVVLSSFALIGSAMVVSKIADIRKAKKNEVQVDSSRRVNEAALQVVTQLVANGLLYFDPAQCSGKGIVVPQTQGATDGVAYSLTGCGASSGASLNCEDANSAGWVYRNSSNLAVVDVCVSASAEAKASAAGGTKPAAKIPVSVTFSEYRKDKFERSSTQLDKTTVSKTDAGSEVVERWLAGVKARRISTTKKYPTLDGEINLGVASDANSGLMGKHGAADMCFYMRPRTVEQGATASGSGKKYLGFEDRGKSGLDQYGSYRYADLEPRPEGKLSDEFGTHYSWEKMTFGGERGSGEDPLEEKDLDPFYAHLSELGEKVLKRYTDTYRIGRTFVQNLNTNSSAFNTPFVASTEENAANQKMVGHRNFLQDGNTYNEYFAGVMPQYEAKQGPNFQHFLTKDKSEPKSWPDKKSFSSKQKENFKDGCKKHNGNADNDFCTRVDVPYKRHEVRFRRKCVLKPGTISSNQPPQYTNLAVNVSCSPDWVNKVKAVYEASVAKDPLSPLGRFNDAVAQSDLAKEMSLDQLVSALEVDDHFMASKPAAPSPSGKFSLLAKATALSSGSGVWQTSSGAADAPLSKLALDYESVKNGVLAMTKGSVSGSSLVKIDPPPPGATSPKTFQYYDYEMIPEEIVENHTSQTCAYFFYRNADSPNECSFAYRTRLESKKVCRNNDGCFDETTLIRMADGSDRVIMNVNAGDFVFNPVTRQPARVVKVVIGPELKPLIHVGVDGKIVKVTGTHPFMTRRGWVQAKLLRKQDEIRMGGNRFAQVTSLELGAVGRTVLNLALEGSAHQTDLHYVLADGVVTGDLVIQNMLEARAERK